jgi:type I restriction enzyme, S subunit
MDVMTENKVVPKLRFREFRGNWIPSTFNEISNSFSYGIGSAAIKYDGENKYLRITDIDEQTRQFKPNPLTTPNGVIDGKYKLKEDDIVFTRTGASVGKSYLYKPSDGNLIYAGFLIKMSVRNANSSFVFFETLRGNYDKWVSIFSVRSGQPGLNAEEYKSYKINLPSLPEQQKIASFLSSVDKKLQQLTKKKELLEEYKKGIMQKIFSQELRFKDDSGNNYPGWEEKKLEEVLFEHKQKSTGKEEVYSVSVHKGLINQIEHLGRSFSAKNTDHYALVKPNDIVYTKSPTGEFPYGIIKQAKIDKEVIVSPLYAVFTPETKYLGYMLDIYFESKHNVHNYLHSIIQKGAKNTINITNSTFLSKSFKLPIDFDEQRKIGSFLKLIDRKIKLVSTQIQKTKAFKKGLLQQMFV